MIKLTANEERMLRAYLPQFAATLKPSSAAYTTCLKLWLRIDKAKDKTTRKVTES